MRDGHDAVAANNAQGTLVRINPKDGLVVGTVPVGHAPTDVATCNELVWVSVQAKALCDRGRGVSPPRDHRSLGLFELDD